MKTYPENNKETMAAGMELNAKMRKKLALTIGGIVLALFLLSVRIYLLQRSSSSEYNKKILAQQGYDSRDISYKRGDIIDRNGTYLATSQKVYNLILDPTQINTKPEYYLDDTVALLVEIFGYDETELRNIIAEKSTSMYIKYDKNLSYEKVEAFLEKQKEINAGYKKERVGKRVHGVWFEESYLRSYPYGSLASHVIGFASSDGSSGTGGIEQYYNSDLIGIVGREYGYLNEDSNLEKVIKPASNGYTVVSTIDVNIQNIVEKHIAEWEAAAPSKMTAVIVMDPNSGEILAMANSKKFDLNNPRDLSAYYSEEELATMNDEAKVEAWNQIWRNFIISDTYEPGSPSKVFTVAMAMEEGVINGSESYNCDGFQIVGEWRIRCVKRIGHGMLTVTESIMQSCNDVMMQIAASVGREKFAAYMKIFGFGQKTGIDLPGEADSSNLIKDETKMSVTDMATNAFGQNYNSSMIQLSAAFCSVINGGYYYEPHIVKQILNEDGSLIENKEPNVLRETITQSTSDFVNEALRRTVAEGTGKSAAVEGYDIGGKTGTAEKYPRGQGRYLVSFAGMAPTSKPKVFCYVIIDEPGVENQASSALAANIFSKIMAEVLPYMNIYPEGVESDVEQVISDEVNEGINEGVNINDAEETVAETKVYETNEYVDTAESIPAEEELPADTDILNNQPVDAELNTQAINEN